LFLVFLSKQFILPCGRGFQCTHEVSKRGLVPMIARARRGITPDSCGNSTVYRWRDRGSPVKTLPLFSNLLCPISSLLIQLFYVMRHIADWITPFHRSRHSFSLPLKFLHTPSSPPPSPSPYMRHS